MALEGETIASVSLAERSLDKNANPGIPEFEGYCSDTLPLTNGRKQHRVGRRCDPSTRQLGNRKGVPGCRVGNPQVSGIP